jgi:hypothetical protein
VQYHISKIYIFLASLREVAVVVIKKSYIENEGKGEGQK